jgi:hypothetical protein
MRFFNFSIQLYFLLFVNNLNYFKNSMFVHAVNKSTDHEIKLNQHDQIQSLEVLKKLLQKTDSVLLNWSIFVIVFGTIFNVLNFICFYRMKKRNSQNIYLSALSIAELFNIHINILLPLLQTSESESHIDTIFPEIIYNSHCRRFYGFLVELALFIPVWIMVLLAAERFISIMWPLKKNYLKVHPKTTLAILFLITTVWCSFKFQSGGVETVSIFKVFTHKSESSPCREITLPYLVNISTFIWCIVPEFLTLIFNLMIIQRINSTTSRHKKFYPISRSKKITQTTRVVMLLSLLFISLISPTGILIIIDTILNFSEDSTFNIGVVKTQMIIFLFRKFALILYEANLIINFPVYLLTIKSFR